MIICHPLKLIFFKTCKTGGTSFEYVLSKYCSDDCIVPILKKNHNNKENGYKFRNHTTTKEAKYMIENIMNEKWYDEYKKICIHRNPFEVFISMFYDVLAFNNGFINDKSIKYTEFYKWAIEHFNQLKLNTDIAPIEDMDFIIRYEYMKEDIKKLNIDNLWEKYSTTLIKTDIRPKESTVEKMYKGQRELIDLICERCKKEIEYFNYKIPLYN